MASTPVEQDQIWRQEYRAHRYLEFATPEDLRQRMIDLSENVYIVDRHGRLSKKPDIPEWLRLVTHIQEEIGIRNIGLQIPFVPPYRNVGRAAELWDPLNLRYGSYLLKFGKREHVHSLFTKGLIRLASAETYNDPKLSYAIADNERLFIQESIGASIDIPPNGDLRVPQEKWINAPIQGTLKTIQNYTGQVYMACFARRYDYRLFEDFEYDACMVIRDPLRFLKKMNEVGETLLPGFQFYFDSVQYRDPFEPKRDNDVLYTKHFKYAYQDEFRVTWDRAPIDGEPPLQSIFLELGPLIEYCDYLVL
jgi:hypothetical protein